MSNEKHKALFELIDKAGGPKLPNIKSLEGSERNKIVFNIWAAIFCPFYYFFHKMWKKAIVYYVLSIILTIILTLIISLVGVEISDMLVGWVASIAIYGTRANVDLYKKYRLNDNSWI